MINVERNDTDDSNIVYKNEKKGSRYYSTFFFLPLFFPRYFPLINQSGIIIGDTKFANVTIVIIGRAFKSKPMSDISGRESLLMSVGCQIFLVMLVIRVIIRLSFFL